MMFGYRAAKRWPRTIYLPAFFLSVCFNACFLWVKVTERHATSSLQPSVQRSSLHSISNTDFKNTYGQPEFPSKQILIVSYMRSGSSLTGDIVQQHREVFYVFEPLFSLERLIKTRMPALYINKTLSLPMIFADSAMLNTVRDVLRCKFKDLDVLTLHQHHLILSQSTIDYYTCVQNKTLLQIDKECLHDLMFQCFSSKYVMVKSIRMTMEMAGALLEQFPGLKVIHLIRDPRGTIMSRVKLGTAQVKSMNIKTDVLAKEVNRATLHCSQVKKDLAETYRLRKRFPGRVAILLYEKLIESPVSMAKELYKFMGMKITRRIKKYIYNITNGFKDTCSVCTVRKNATSTAYNWRTLINFPAVFSIDSACADVYSELGFINIKSESNILNSSFKTWREKYVPGMLTNNPNAKLLVEYF